MEYLQFYHAHVRIYWEIRGWKNARVSFGKRRVLMKLSENFLREECGKMLLVAKLRLKAVRALIVIGAL